MMEGRTAWNGDERTWEQERRAGRARVWKCGPSRGTRYDAEVLCAREWEDSGMRNILNSSLETTPIIRGRNQS